jgi:hypothetical protein
MLPWLNGSMGSLSILLLSSSMLIVDWSFFTAESPKSMLTSNQITHQQGYHIRDRTRPITTCSLPKKLDNTFHTWKTREHLPGRPVGETHVERGCLRICKVT